MPAWSLSPPSGDRRSVTAAAVAAAAAAVTALLKAQQSDMLDLLALAWIARAHPPQQARAHDDRGRDGQQDHRIRQRIPQQLRRPARAGATGERLAEARQTVGERAQ